MDPIYSFVLPIFNEEAVLPFLFARLEAVLDALDGPSEVIFVDDGSTDASPALLTQRVSEDPRFRYIGLSRNFGQQIAMTAGLDAASGQAIILMDGDLQDPPELIFQMVEKWREGFDVVYAQRKTRAGESRFKLMTASLFYRMMSKLAAIDLPRNVAAPGVPCGEFCDRRSVLGLCGAGEMALSGVFRHPAGADRRLCRHEAAMA